MYECRLANDQICQNDGCTISQRESGRCFGKCVPVKSLIPVYNWEIIDVDVSTFENCTVEVFSASVPGTCCEMVSCAIFAPNASCVASNALCRSTRQGVLNSVEGIMQESRELFQNLLNAQKSLSLAQTASNTADIAYKILIERRDQLSMSQIRLQDAHVRSEEVYNATLEEIAPLLEIYESGETIIIDNVTFIQEVSNIPTYLVLNITFEKFIGASNVIYKEEFVYYPQRGQANIENFADEIINLAFFGKFKRSTYLHTKMRRQLPSEFTQRQIFDLRCAQVSNIQLFFMEIKAILMEVYASIEASLETTTLLSQILRNDDLSNNEEFEAYLDFIKKYEDLSVEALHALETTLFSEWQASMEFLYSESGSVGEISCDGFADCLQISLDEIQHLVGLTPTNELNEDFLSLLQDFSIAKQKVLELALFSNITIDEGLTRIDPIIEITSAYATDNYWCNEPPVITIHPPPEVNISRGGTLQLRCDAKSKLAVTYEWERDGNILTQFTANELIVPAIQQFDSANYTCFANNPVGRAESITTSVTVYELPQFYLLPESVVTYFGDGNGAWFACNATAWPYPGWRWFYRSTNDKDWIIIDGEETNELLIMTPQKENEGIYACEAYNYHGSIRSEAVTLTLLPFTVSQQQFPVEFSISLANPSCSLEELYDSLYSFIFEAIDGESSIIEDFNITEVEMGSYDVSLTLLSANVTTHYLNFMTFAEIANLALPHATSLRNSISFITNVLDGDIGSHICPQSNSSVIENSLIVGRLTYICSPGQRLNSDYLLCCKLNYNT